MDDDPSVAKFRHPAPPEESGIIILCDEGREFLKRYARNSDVLGARVRIAERERLARLRGVKVSRPELHVVDELASF